MTDLSIPQGQLLHSRIVPDIRTVFSDALDRELTGYALIEFHGMSQTNRGSKGILTFENGIPMLAHYTGTDTSGKHALAVFPTSDSCRLDLYALSSEQLDAAHERLELRIPPEMPANYLAGDRRLAVRTRKQAAMTAPMEAKTEPTRRTASPDTEQEPDTEPPERRTGRHTDAVEAFLEDTERIEAIRRQARNEAKRQATEWGIADHLNFEAEAPSSTE